MEFTLLWAALTAVFAVWLGLRIWRERVPERATDRLMAATLWGLVVGRLTAMVGQGVNPLTNPAEIIILRGGVSTWAAAISFLVALIWSTRRLPSAVDAMAPAITLGLAGWHAGCLWRGACLGTPSDLPWAWPLPGSSVTRHPVELYTAIALVLAAWVIASLPWRLWLKTGAALVAAAGVRLLSGPLRPSLGSEFDWWLIAGLLVGVSVMAVGPLLPRPKETLPT